MAHDYHPDAHNEFDAASIYYAAREPGLQTRFIDAVEKAIARACSAPQQFPLLGGGKIHRVLVDKFPYAVLYAIRGDRILIIAVMHCSRRPGYWKERME